jgi:tRNA pseudouridine38-40 synthase
MRYLLILEYDGRPFCGWQKQPGHPSVQETLETALTRLTQETVTVWTAGRTDQGVHALGQAAHMDLKRPFSLDSLRRGLNFYMKDLGVSVLEVRSVPSTFHARFSACARSYLYRILNRPSASALEEGRVWWVHRPLDLQRMQEGAALLLGTHDFNAFRAKECQSNLTLRTLDVLDLQKKDSEIHLRIQARAFLHHQVRIMVGTLKQIGEGKREPSSIPDIFASGQRAYAGPTAPPEGLYLERVDYLPEVF